MYTIIWVDSAGQEHYERFDFADEVLAFIRQQHIEDEEDLLIFPPDTDISMDELI